MYLRSLELTEFRNFPKLQIDLRPRVNFLVGDNGHGKTNFLEAIHLLSRGTSFRPSSQSNFLRENATLARIRGEFQNGVLDYDLEVLFTEGRKLFSINNKRTNSSSLIRLFPSVLFSPESLAAIKEGPDLRRQLVDEVLLTHDPRQITLLREFIRSLRSRNAILANIAEGIGHRGDNEETLESLNKIYFILATHLTSARLVALKAIAPLLKDSMAAISDGGNGASPVDISVDYVISDQSALDWDDSQIFEALQVRHRMLAQREMASGSSLVGPHKHDIKFLFNGNDSRFYCSQGQQRALILAFKIAQIVYHQSVHQTYPVLLLDDVLSELDFKKRVNLMKFLEGISAQILMTATDLTWSQDFGFDRNSILRVVSGEVQRMAVDQIHPLDIVR